MTSEALSFVGGTIVNAMDTMVRYGYLSASNQLLLTCHFQIIMGLNDLFTKAVDHTTSTVDFSRSNTASTGRTHAWSKHHWQDEYAISLICIFLYIFSYFDLAKTIEIDALRFQNKDLNVVGTLEYGQFGVVRLFAILPVCYLLKIR